MTTPSFYLGDLTTGQIVGDLPLSTCQWSRAISSAGGWSATLSMGNKIVTPDLLTLGRSVLWVDLDGELEFGGILWNLKIAPEAGILTLGGEGIWSYLHHRNIRSTLTYTAADLFTVVAGLITAAQTVANGNIGLTVTFPTGNPAGVARTITYNDFERKPYADAIEELAAAEDGFEFVPTYAWISGLPTTILECHHRRLGRSLGTAWELAHDVAISGDYQLDGSALANLVDAAGSGSGAGRLYQSSTGALLDGRPRLDAVTTHNQTTDTTQLLAEANDDLDHLAVPRESFKLKLLNPSPLPADWGLGDETFVVGELGAGWQLDDEYRIVAYQATVDANGALAVEVEVVLGALLGAPFPPVQRSAAAAAKRLQRRVGVLERL